MTDLKKSPLAPDTFPTMPIIAGVHLGTAAAGVRYQGRTDVMFAAFTPGTQVAGVFTQSTMPGAPVKWCRNALQQSSGTARALVVKAGNANVFTAEQGHEACQAIAEATAAIVDVNINDVLLSATGVIGEPLPYQKVIDVLPAIELGADQWENAAQAIMTTDTFAKAATAQANIDGATVTINGIAKGSGMIEPNMATMLAYIATDATLSASVLDNLLRAANETSFNAITVDSDTSTSDTVLLFATGMTKHDVIDNANDSRLNDFKTKLSQLMKDLAHQIIRDGEGASKFITVHVNGAETDAEAKIAAKSIANSPLVKTAIAGEDANWGRVVMAIGKSGIRAYEKKLSVIFGGQSVTENGKVREGYDESILTNHLKGKEINLTVELGIGNGQATVWTCDLTHGYIDINADYRS